MPMIECPDCKNQVSDKAKVCPNCGYPIESYVKKLEKEKRKASITPEMKKKRIKIAIISSVAFLCVVAIVVGICVPFSNYKRWYHWLEMYDSYNIYNYRESFEHDLYVVPSYYKDTKKIQQEYELLKEQTDELDRIINKLDKTVWSSMDKNKLQKIYDFLINFPDDYPDSLFTKGHHVNRGYIDYHLDHLLYRILLYKYNFRSEDNQYYLYFTSDYSFSTNLPKPINSNYTYYYGRDYSRIGCYLLYYNKSDTVSKDSETINAFQISMELEDLSNDKVLISVYCYKDSKTYTLYGTAK